MLDRHSERALYRQLADDLRAKIVNEELAPGARLQGAG
jgi:DNA-binding GntR family transcriptional regulator